MLPVKAAKRVIIGVMAAALLVTGFAGCKKDGTVEKFDGSFPQFTELKQGEDIAVMTVKGYGTIKIRFFKKQAPKAVENFITHAKEGYYNNVKFHRVMEEFMIQGGDPEGTGMGGESIWGEGFGIEISENLRHFRGALAMARTQDPNSNGSQFYIVNATTVTDSDLDYAEQNSGEEIPEEVREKYKEVGGYPYLDGSYTVFGQVIEGMDVVDKISACDKSYSSSGEPSVPKQDIVIEKIEMTTYGK